MNVSVLIVAYHGDAWIPACLASLAEASVHRMRLLLVDNSGNTVLDSVDLSRFDAEILKTPHPMGFAEANNYALLHAERLEEVVLFLNQDTISPAGWIDACLACFERSGELGAVSPLIRTYDGTGWDPSFQACLSEPGDLEHLASAAAEGSWFRTNKAPAPALMVRTDVLHRTGPFDPVFGSYYEDYDLCRRIRGAGYEIGFSRSAHILHFSGSTSNTRERELRRMRQIIRNRLLHEAREAGGARKRRLARHFLLDLPRNLLRGVLRTPSSQPPIITLEAHGDLLKCRQRLFSERADQLAWHQYLEEVGWTEQMVRAQSKARRAEPVTP